MILLLSVIARINVQVIISSVSVFGFYARSISVGKATSFSARKRFHCGSLQCA